MDTTLAKRAATSIVTAAALVAAVGCGETGSAGRGSARTLNIHASGQLRYWGDAVRAEQLAMEEAGRRAGRFEIRLIVHDEASPDNDISDPEGVRRNAEAAPAIRTASLTSATSTPARPRSPRRSSTARACSRSRPHRRTSG